MAKSGRARGGSSRGSAKWLGALGGALLATAAASPAVASNYAVKIYRVDPQSTIDGKDVVISMLVELGTPIPIDSLQQGCNNGGTTNGAQSQRLTCISNKIEKNGYEEQVYNKDKPDEPFPKEDAQLLDTAYGKKDEVSIVDAVPYSKADVDNGGVAWLIVLDASSSLDGSRWAEEQDAAEQIIKLMGKHDAVSIRLMDDKGTRVSTGWLPAASKQKAIDAIRSVKTSFPSGAKVDALISRIETAATGGFESLLKDGVEGQDEGTWPLMQALVVLSDGGDSSASGYAGEQTAQALHQSLAKGEGFSPFTKTPIPVISLWFPDPHLTGGIGNEENELKTNNAIQWMSNIATPEVGGYFDIIQAGETGKGTRIAQIIRHRFDNLYYLTLKPRCLDPSGKQTFTLAFPERPNILPDEWSNVTVAFHPDKWPIAVDKKKTEAVTASKPLLPDQPFSVFGDFCFDDKSQVDAYFITDADAADVKKAVADTTGKKLKALAQNLSAKGQKAETVSASLTEAVFKAPNTPALFDNKGDAFTLNVVVVDTRDKRVSALDQKSVLALRAGKTPMNKFIIVGGIAAVVVLVLLIAILARGGGGGGRARRRGGQPGRPPGP